MGHTENLTRRPVRMDRNGSLPFADYSEHGFDRAKLLEDLENLFTGFTGQDGTPLRKIGDLEPVSFQLAPDGCDFYTVFLVDPGRIDPDRIRAWSTDSGNSWFINYEASDADGQAMHTDIITLGSATERNMTSRSLSDALPVWDSWITHINRRLIPVLPRVAHWKGNNIAPPDYSDS